MALKTLRGISKKPAFLAAFIATASISAAADACQLERGLHYRWLQDDPEYVAAFNAARDQAAQSLEDEAIRRAHAGVSEPVVYQGSLCYERKWDAKKKEWKYSTRPLVIRKYSDALMMFLLRGMRPDKYRERGSMELTGPGGGPLEIVERLKAGRDRIAKQKTVAKP